MLQEGGPFQDLTVGSCLTEMNGLEETHMLTRQETLLGKDTGGREG